MDSPGSILKRYGLRAKKSWGQCFLHDPSVIAKIVEVAGIVPGDTVVEIGAGLGSLTGALAATGSRVIAIERDRDLVRVLREELAGQANVEIAEENALTYDLGALGAPVVVVGNLPYNIASPLLFHLVSQRRHLRSATLMLQRELAERIAAAPGTRECGAPSVLLQAVAEVRLCLRVPGGAFVPRPRVESAVVRVVPRERARVDAEWPVFEAAVRAAFHARRKTLRRALCAAFEGDRVSAALAASGVDGGRRGETLTVEEFGRLAQALAESAAAREPGASG